MVRVLVVVPVTGVVLLASSVRPSLGLGSVRLTMSSVSSSSGASGVIVSVSGGVLTVCGVTCATVRGVSVTVVIVVTGCSPGVIATRGRCEW